MFFDLRCFDVTRTTNKFTATVDRRGEKTFFDTFDETQMSWNEWEGWEYEKRKREKKSGRISIRKYFRPKVKCDDEVEKSQQNSSFKWD